MAHQDGVKFVEQGRVDRRLSDPGPSVVERSDVVEDLLFVGSLDFLARLRQCQSG